MVVAKGWVRSPLLACSFAALVTGCGGPNASGQDEAVEWPRLSYAGRDSLGVPHYITRPFTAEERRLLFGAFGVGDPRRLYLSDSTATAVLAWDVEDDAGREDLVYSFKVGFTSLRRPGESLAQYKERNVATPPSAFPPFAGVRDTALGLLDPSARPLFGGLLEAARARGFDVQVAETYRSPTRQGWLMSSGDGWTFTGTSFHSYGRAVDFVIGDGYGQTPRNRREYVAFRRFVLEYGEGRLKLMGTPEDTWDWGHVEAPAAWLGFRSVEDALSSARTCLDEEPHGAEEGLPSCVFQPRLGGRRDRPSRHRPMPPSR